MNSTPTVAHRIPNSIEVTIVMAVAFWWFIYESMRWFFRTLNEYGWTIWESATIEGSRVGYLAERVAVFEIFFFLKLFAFLKRRGWTWSDLKLSIGIRSAWHAIVLFLAIFVIHLIFFKVHTIIHPPVQLHVGSLFDSIYPDVWSCLGPWQLINYYTWLPSIIIDAFYWEFFLLCYLFKRFDKASPFAVIGLGAAVRLLCYVHTGPVGWISILLVSVLIGWYYWKFRNLTVALAVHVLWNFTAFGFYTVD